VKKVPTYLKLSFYGVLCLIISAQIDAAMGLKDAFSNKKTRYETCREACVFVYSGNRKRMRKCFTLCCISNIYECQESRDERNGA
jgi:hypothetical protein